MTAADRAALRAQLIGHEGLKLTPYVDSVGKLTIGVGRNLTDVGISPHEALEFLDHDIDAAIAGIQKALPWTSRLDAVRFRVLIDMAFNLGVTGLLGFRRMLAALQADDYGRAADEMVQSAWVRQVGARALRLAEMMRTGVELDA